MKILGSAALFGALLAGSASAATFAGYETTGTTLYSGDATINAFPGGLGFIDSNDFLAQIAYDFSLSSSLSINDGGAPPIEVFSSATLLDYTLVETVGQDEIAFLFDLDTGPFAIATFSGDLDGFGGFASAGAFDPFGTLTIVEAAVVPLPAGGVLFLTGLAALGALRRKRRRS